ncbi:PRTRC system protein C [Acidicapsa dinghuensis]|uniref:PRTRC system protein C n=1 Tax=Acidicapsa dinghuensis TaxID=2218256 RepID=A0ABW1EDF2_9BACT|nr:PRTRC system protein C [Acidicapsa dinghuensis]
MASLTASALRREFVYNGTVIPDPNPSLSPEQVRDTLVAAYPEIATAALSGPEVKSDSARYTFSRAIGSKG